MATSTNDRQMPEYQNILYKKTFRFYVITMIAFVVLSVILGLLTYKTDIFFKTNLFDVEGIPGGTFNVIEENTYSGKCFDLELKSFDRNENTITAELVLTNKLAEEVQYHTRDFQVYKYVDNKRDMRMTYYPENYADSYTLASGEQLILFLNYNLVEIESKSGTVIYCVGVDNPDIPEKVIIVR